MFVKLLLLLMLNHCIALICANKHENDANNNNNNNQKKIISNLPESILGLEDSTLQEHPFEMSELLSDLRFEPQQIDFGAWFVGQAHSQTITLLNQHANRSVQLNSVSGPTPAFYSSFFEVQEVPPKGNTTFNVVFLPRELGAISTGLHIHTSFGRAEISVRGIGRECPYRLKPLVGIKAPINATLAPEVYMYNPHERPLQILEVYSSGGEFQLELPTGSGGREGSQKLWQIPPYSAKPVIRISFHGRTVGNHTAYIRIKISEQRSENFEASENILVIPVEFEILPKATGYARNPVVDFGRISTGGNSDPLRFKLDIQNDQIATQTKEFIGRYLHNIPGLTFDANSTSVILDPKLFDQSAAVDEYLVIRSNSKSIDDDDDSQEFTVLVRAEIFKGDLHYDKNITLFATGGSVNLETERILILRNDFEIPLLLYNVTLVEPVNSTQLEIANIDQPIVLQPGQSLDLLQLKLLNKSAEFHSMLRIDTNVTSFEIPVVAAKGTLHVSTHEDFLHIATPFLEFNTELNLGAIPYADMSRDGFIALRNDNPMPIKLTNWDFKSPQSVYFHASFLGCLSAKAIAQLKAQNETKVNVKTTKFTFCSYLGEGDTAIFQLAIKSFVTEETTGNLLFWTPYELITTKVKFIASVGQLEVHQEQMHFKNCFPGKICSAVLSIRSTFMQPIHIQTISFKIPGLRFKDFNAKGTKILPETLTKVGRIYFEPAALCRDNCYINRADRESDTKTLFDDKYEVDVALLRRRAELFRKMRRQLQTMSLKLSSRELPPIELDFAIDIEWPKLVVQRRDPNQQAPTTEVGRVQQQAIVLSNPTQHTLLVDYFLADHRIAQTTQFTIPRELIDSSFNNCYLTAQAVFSLVNPPTPSKPILMPPGSNISVPVEFSESAPGKHCTLLHIRNNLTLYEAVWITARAVHSQFRFGNRKPGSQTPLLFDFTEKQLKESCSNKDNGSIQTAVISAKRTFTARNSGEVPILVDGFFIGDQPCEGHGFRVHDCESFELKENETRKIEISFSSDFTNSRVVRPLVLKTNLSYEVSYKLTAQLPAASLERCASRLERPEWERRLCTVAMVSLGVTFLLVLIAAFVDYREIMMQQSTLYAARYRGPVQPTFNLRNISAKIEQDEELPTENKIESSSLSNVVQRPSKTNQSTQSNLRKRSTPSATAKKSSKWSSWNMSMLMPKNEMSNRVEKTSLNKPSQAATSEESTATKSQAPPTSTKSFSPPNDVVKTSKKSSCSPPQPVRVSAKKSKHQSAASSPPPPPPIPTTAKASNEILENTSLSTEKELNKNQTNTPENLLTSKQQASPPSPVTPTIKKEIIHLDEQPNKVLKEQNSLAKKGGKTPGRERRREKTISPGATNGVNRKIERKPPRIKQLSFDATAPASGPGIAGSSVTPLSSKTSKDYNTLPLNNCITSPWQTTNPVSFSQVLQTHKNENKLFPPSSLAKLQNNASDWSRLSANINNQQSSIEQLGPIGSKKSPLQQSMSTWESATPPMMPSQSPLSNVGLTTNNGSLFPDMDTFTEHQLTSLSAELYELQREQLRRQWETNELILMQQQQERIQEQLQREMAQQQQHLQGMDTTNWTTSMWSPSAYNGQWPTSSTNSTSTSSFLRPPPGLESNLNTIGHMPMQTNNGGGSTSSNNTTTAQNIITSSTELSSHPFNSIWANTWLEDPSTLTGQQQQRHNSNNNHMN